MFRANKDAHRVITVPFPKSNELFLAQAPLPGEIIAFFTPDSFYEQEAGRMVASARRLGLSVTTTPVESAGSWVRNAALKPTFLLGERREKRGPLLYVDVDAVFHRDPWPILSACACDVAVYREHGRLISATILLHDTVAAQRLLEMWKEGCDRDPEIWDQIVLEQILDEDQVSGNPQFKVCELPVSLCWIFDHTGDGLPEVVYIEQLQASRQAMIEKHFGRERSKLRRRRRRVAEIERILSEGD
ncbi:putative nucleotide-diphospho-sugar transferase [Rhizobium binxianense]